jgi:hypothetical protein
MSSGGGSNQLPHDWHLDAMGISSAGGFRTPPMSLSSCLARDDPQLRRDHLACAFGIDPSSLAGSCHLDTSGCYHCASGTAPVSFLPARTSRASYHEALQQFSVCSTQSLYRCLGW